MLGVTDVGNYFPHRVTYHPSCHGKRMLKLGDKPYELLRNVRRSRSSRCRWRNSAADSVVPSPSRTRTPGAAMANDKARHVRETGAEYVVAGDNSCLLNIGGILARQNSGVKAIHLADILANTEED